METNKNIVDFMKPRERESISDDYLNGLVSNVMFSVNEKESKKIVPFYKKAIVWFSSAAAVVLIIVSIKSFNQSATISSDFNAVSKSELLAYINENIEDFDPEFLVKHVPVEYEQGSLDEVVLEIGNGVSEPSTKEAVVHPSLDKEFDKINKEDVLDYLKEEGLNYEDLQEFPDLVE